VILVTPAGIVSDDGPTVVTTTAVAREKIDNNNSRWIIFE